MSLGIKNSDYKVLSSFLKELRSSIPVTTDNLIYDNDRLITPIFKVNDEFKDKFNKHVVLHTSDKFDSKWLEASKKYVNGLGAYEKNLILSYTHHGDVYANTFIRNPTGFVSNPQILAMLKQDIERIFNDFEQKAKGYKTFPLAGVILKLSVPITAISKYLDNDFILNNSGIQIVYDYVKNTLGITPNNISTTISKIIPLLKTYIQDLSNIINKGPSPTQITRVFRGISDDYLEEVNTPKEILGFTSTTYDLYVAKTRFSKYNMIYEIEINPGTPCLVIPTELSYPTKEGKPEYEVLINSGAFLTSSKTLFKQNFEPNKQFLYLPYGLANGVVASDDVKKRLKDRTLANIFGFTQGPLKLAENSPYDSYGVQNILNTNIGNYLGSDIVGLVNGLAFKEIFETRTVFVAGLKSQSSSSGGGMFNALKREVGISNQSNQNMTKNNMNKTRNNSKNNSKKALSQTRKNNIRNNRNNNRNHNSNNQQNTRDEDIVTVTNNSVPESIRALLVKEKNNMDNL